MAMLFMESFSGLNPYILTQVGKWLPEGNTLFYTGVATHRTGVGHAWAFKAYGWPTYIMEPYGKVDLGTNQGVVIIGVAARLTEGWDVGNFFLRLTDAVGVPQLLMRFDAFMHPIVVRNDGTTLLTFAEPMFLGRWHYLEFAMKIHSTAGWIEGRLDTYSAGGGVYYGTTGTNRGNANGNTRYSSSTLNSARYLSIGTQSYVDGARGTIEMSDLVVMNDVIQSPLCPNNDFLGDIRVVISETIGPGAHTDFAIGGSSPAATNWQSVNVIPLPGDVKFVQSNLVGEMDTYEVADLPPSTISVYAISVGTVARKADAGPRSLAPVIRWDGAPGSPMDLALGSGAPLQDTYAYKGGILETRPDGAAWTDVDVNDLEVGMTVTI